MVATALDLLRGPPKTLDILVHLSDKDEEEEVGKVMSALDLSSSSFYPAIDRLELLGFLYKRREKGYPPHTYVILTNKGREVAKLLFPLAEVVGSTIQGLKLDLEELEGKERTEEDNRRMVEVLRDLQDISFTLGEWDEAEAHARRIVDIASASDDNENLSKSYRMLGEIHFQRGEYERSKSELSNSLNVSKKTGDLKGEAEARYLLGANLEDGGEFQEALKEYEKAVKKAKSTESEILEARSKLGLGRMLAREGSYENSLKILEESVTAFEKLGQDDELPRAYANAGATAFYIDLDESIRWHTKSMDAAVGNSDLRMLGYSLMNLAGCMNKKGELKKALDYLERASEISERIDEKKLICSINIQKGWMHRLEGKLGESDTCFRRAVRVAEEYDLPYYLGDSLLNWAQVDAERGEKAEARKKLKRALEIFDGLGSKARMSKVRKILRKLSR